MTKFARNFLIVMALFIVGDAVSPMMAQAQPRHHRRHHYRHHRR